MASGGRSRRFFRPTWAEIDLSRLRDNLRRLKRRLPGVRLMFVVKGNAYGHGAASCALAAQKGGAADWLGVSSVEEGISLREAGVKLPILVLGSLYPFESFLAAAEYRLTPTVASLQGAQALSAAACRLGRTVGCHLKVDTGMGRIGARPSAALAVAGYLLSQKAARLEGVYTHLACADSDPAFTRRQLRDFSSVAEALEARGLRGLLRHAANSAGALRYPESRWDMVRPGLAAYGLGFGLAPVMSLKSKIVFLKTVPKSTPIGYGASFRARRTSRIATLPVGYADGVFRGLSNKGWALVGGRRCPIVGRVSMDMLTLDVTDAGRVGVGDEAVLIGAQRRERISAGEVAETLGTIPYEVACAVSSRVPRVYLS